MISEKYKSLINLTVKNIQRKKLRSALTILSVIIGIASVVALVILSEGLISAVTDQFDKMGANSIMILPTNFGGNPHTAGRVSEETMLNMKDADNLSKLAEIEDTFPLMLFTAKGEYKNEEQFVYVSTIPSDRLDSFIDYVGVEIKEGKSFDGKDGHFAVVGPNFTKTYKREIKVGDTIKLNGVNFKICGILSAIGMEEYDATVYIGRKAGLEINDYGETVNYIILKSKKDADAKIVVKKAEKVLGKTRKEDTFLVISAESFLALIKIVLNIMRSILIAIAGISLIVASLGIANSIFTSVLERTKEIGILKSIGARINDIVFIFVLESVLLTVIGGIIGFFVGIGIAKLIIIYAATKDFTMLAINITPWLVISTLLLSLIVGIISGLFPARAAAKMNVVDALRKQ